MMRSTAIAVACTILGLVSCASAVQSQTELEDVADALKELYDVDARVAPPNGLGGALVRCTINTAGAKQVDGTIGLVIRDEVVLVPLARLVNGESVKVKAPCCEPRPAAGVYAFDASVGLALLSVPGLQTPPWNDGYGELPSPAPESLDAEVAMPFEIAGAMGVGAMTLAVIRDVDSEFQGRRLRLDHSYRDFGAGAILVNEAGLPIAISTEWAGNNKSWAVSIARFLDEHLGMLLDDGSLISVDDLIESAPDDRSKSMMLTWRAGSEIENRVLLDIAIDLDPKNALAHYHRGVVFDKMGDKNESLKALYKSLDLDDNWSESWYSLGLVQLTSDQPVTAVDSFRRSVGLDSTHADAHAMMGLAHLNAGQPDRAIDAMHRAVELEPGRRHFAANLGVAYERADRSRESYKAWEAYAKAEPSDRGAHYTYCRTLAVGGQFERLEEVASAGIDRFGENADDLAFQAFAYAAAERELDEARRLIGRALELEPDHAFARTVRDRLE